MHFCNFKISSSIFGASSDFAFGQDDDDNLFLSPSAPEPAAKQTELVKDSPEVKRE